MTPLKFNLSEDLVSVGITNREFAPPFAAFVPDGSNIDPFALPATGMPPPSVYTFAEQHVNDVDRNETTDVKFTIIVNSPGGFPTETAYPNLPPPAIRLHAMAWGTLSFLPGPTEQAPGTLVLRTKSFIYHVAPNVPWYQRWNEAHCNPEFIYYDNVDRQHLDTYLRSLPFGGAFGLRFGDSKTLPVTDANARDTFVREFLKGNVDADGNPTHVMTAEPSAVLGRAALSSSTAGELSLRVRYADHTPAAPQPMNPRELLYLMFGNTSKMATDHPLLKAMDTLPLPVPRRTTTTILRPALRTWGRLMWEADLEAANDQSISAEADKHWTSKGNLGDRLFDTQFRRSIVNPDLRPISYAGGIPGSFKCNVFTSDICVRAGFRAMIGVFQNDWHYPTSGSHTHSAVSVLEAEGGPPPGRYPILGRAPDDATRVYGYALTGYLHEKLLADLNELMTVHGRALLMTGSRPKKPTGKEGVGHIVLVREFPIEPGNPKIKDNVDKKDPSPGDPAPVVIIPKMVTYVRMFTAQANGTNGAVSNMDYSFRLGGKTKNPSDGGNFIRIHLIEAAPGRDPDLLQGLFDLHIKRVDPNQLPRAIDRLSPF